MKTYIIALWLCLLISAAAQEFRAQAGIGSLSIFVGQEVQFQIQVEGADSPAQPDLSSLTDFVVETRGSGTSSSRSIQIINGKRTSQTTKKTTFNYLLRAKKVGQLPFPAITVKAGNEMTATMPFTLEVKALREIEDFKLRVEFSKPRAYVGEQIELLMTFYFKANARDLNISLPLTDDKRFKVSDLETDQQDSYPVKTLDGVQYQTVTLRKLVTPRVAGTYDLEPVTMSFQGEDGKQVERDFFGRESRQARYRDLIIPSNDLGLEVLSLPTKGQPSNYNGHVGRYALQVQASPLEVNVGDPITLQLAMTGAQDLNLVEPPNLAAQENLISDFKVPTEIEDGELSGNAMLFSQTIRASHDGVTRIPPLELPYFDVKSGTYKIAKTKAIPIKVNKTRMVTIEDAEGLGPAPTNGRGVASSELGLAHNYTGKELLVGKQIGFSRLFAGGRWLFFILPPIFYFGALAFRHLRKREAANPAKKRERQALTTFTKKSVAASNLDDLLAAFSGFLGQKLHLDSEALTYLDVAQPLADKGVNPALIEDVKALYAQGDLSRFSGATSDADLQATSTQATSLVQQLDKTLR